MSELKEAIAAIDAGAEPDECPFKATVGPKNKTKPTPGEDNDTVNDSGELTDALEVVQPLPTSVYPADGTAPGSVSSGPNIGVNIGLLANAHHLVPGHASLPYADLCAFMGDKDNIPEKSSATPKVVDGGGGIGYDVNDSRNGTWLPSNNALRGRWDSKIQAEYAFIAINRTNAQFHDAHPNYSRFVLERLQEINVALGSHIQKCKLEPCKSKKQPADKFEHGPYPHLTTKLYLLSTRMRKYLRLSSLKFWHNPELTTSRFCIVYYQIATGKLTAPAVVPFAGGKKPVTVTDPAIVAVLERRTSYAR